MTLHVDMAETDPTHGTHGNKRAWLEDAVALTLSQGYRSVLSGSGRAAMLDGMANAGLGDYRTGCTTEDQDRVIIACIDTALLFML